jgi:predicted permease
VTSLAASTGATLLAILKIFVVIFAAGILVRRGVLSQAMVTALSRATVVLFLPCLIFAKVLANFQPAALPLWWALPLAGIMMPVVGLGLGALAFARELPEKRNLLPLASMQNAGYLILPVGLALYPGQFDEFALYCFLFILGYNPVLWSVGKLLTTDGSDGERGWRGLLTPPLVANVVAVVCALVGGRRLIPSVLFDAVDLIGQAAVPVATVVLGAVLGSVTVRLRSQLWDIARVLAIKLGLLPLLTILGLVAVGVGPANPLLASFLVLESAAAPAAGLILQVRAYGGDEQKVGTVMLASYAACIITMPLWLAVWKAVAA